MRRLLVRLACPWVFRSPEAHARHLRGLAATEQGSYFSLQWAAQRSPSLERQALYLRHASDEARHAQIFWGRAEALEPPTGPLFADAEDLYASLGEVGFVAFVHHAEKRGREQFEIYADYFGRKSAPLDAKLFSAVTADERHHERYSLKLLVELTGSEDAARRSLRRVRLWEAFRLWKRSGQTLAGALYALLIWGLFPILFPYSLVARLALPARSGFLSRSSPGEHSPEEGRG